MAVGSQQIPSLFDDKQQIKRWQTALSNNRKRGIDKRNVPVSNDEQRLTTILDAIGAHPKDVFQYRQLSTLPENTHPSDMRPVMYYLVKYGLLLKEGKQPRGIRYQRMFKKEDIPMILKEREKTIKTLTDKQRNFLADLKEEGQYRLYRRGRKMTKIEHLTLIYYYYLLFKGGVERKNRLKYFKKQCTSSNKGQNRPIYHDIPMKKGQIQKVMYHGRDLGIMTVVKKSHQDLYQFKKEVIQGGEKELLKRLKTEER